MNSNLVLAVFIVEFIALAAWAATEKNWPNFLYGLGGAILNIGVLLMGMSE